ncbi:MAG: phosphoribosylaminoimidazolesuccinocarboxamide synthase [bacterium]|nr:phosphoribosylaminoimidazolesuccinocarboxamide synthase [bacterium]
MSARRKEPRTGGGVGKSGVTHRTKRLHEDGPGTLEIEFLDQAVLPDGRLKAPFKGKGALCARFSEAVFRYLESYNIGHHFLGMTGENRMKVRRLEMLPLTVLVRSIAAADLTARFGVPEGQVLDVPILELFYKRPGQEAVPVNPSHCQAFHLASEEELRCVDRLATKINAVLRSFFDRRDILLVDVELEFGRTQGGLLLGDEISPDTCRLWDRRTRRKYDSDCMRSGLAGAEAAYRDVLEKVLG